MQSACFPGHSGLGVPRGCLLELVVGIKAMSREEKAEDQCSQGLMLGLGSSAFPLCIP